MTPLDAARLYARNPDTAARGVAMLARGLSDDDPANPTRAGWPLAAAVDAAIEYLDLSPTPALRAEALALAPTIPGYMLNRAE